MALWRRPFIDSGKYIVILSFELDADMPLPTKYFGRKDFENVDIAESDRLTIAATKFFLGKNYKDLNPLLTSKANKLVNFRILIENSEELASLLEIKNLCCAYHVGHEQFVYEGY